MRVRPEHATPDHLEVAAGQQVVDTDATQEGCGGALHVIGRTRRSALQRTLALGHVTRVLDAGVVEELSDRRDAVVAGLGSPGLGVQVSRDDEGGVSAEATAASLVVVKRLGTLEVQHPETNLVEVPPAIPVLAAVEHRGRRMTGPDVQDLVVVDDNGKIPMGLG